MRQPLPHRTRAALVGVVVPALIYLTGLAVVLAIWGRMPPEVVVHIGPGGMRLGDPMEVVGALAVMGGGGSVVLAGLSMAVGRTSISRQLVLGIATGWAALMTGMVLAFLLPQLGGPATSFDLPLTIALLVSVAAGVGAAACAGDDPVLAATEPVPDDAVRAGEDRPQVWQQRADISSRGWRWFLILSALYTAGAITLGLVSGSWFVTVVLAVPLVVPAVMMRWQVRVDRTGLTVTAGHGGAPAWPRQHIPAAEVLRADVTEVRPGGQFGGWGLRIAPDQHGTVAVVVRTGDAITVQRTGGRRFVVTVDDARSGAALLNTMADRARTDQDSGGAGPA